MIAILNQASCI